MLVIALAPDHATPAVHRMAALSGARVPTRVAATLLGVTLASSLSSGLARAQTATIEVVATTEADGTVVPNTQYTIYVGYQLAGGDIEDPAIEVDLPPGVIFTDFGSIAPFTGHCDSQGTPGTNMYGNHLDWTCTLSASAIDVPSGGISGEVALRVRYMTHYFVDTQAVSIEASMSGDNFTASMASDEVQVNAWLGFTEPLGGLVHYGVAFARRDAVHPVGSVLHHTRKVNNSGNGFVHPGFEVRETFPAGTTYLGSPVQDGAAWTTASPLWGDASTLVHVTPLRLGFSAVGRTASGAAGGRGTISQFLNYTYSYLWNECGTVPEAASWASTIWGSVALDGSGFGQLTAPSYPGAFAVREGGSYTPPSCANTAEARFSGMVSRRFESWFQVQLAVTPPAGTVPVYDMYAAYALPTGMEYREPRIEAAYNPTEAATSDFSLYRCLLPALVGATFTKAQFETFLSEGVCNVWPRRDPTILDESQVTHLVVHAPELSSSEPWGETVWYPYYAGLSMRKNTCGSAPVTIQHRGYVSGRRTPGGALEVATTSEDQTLNNLESMAVVPYSTDALGATITSLARGASASHRIFLAAEFLVNPRGTVRLPPGVIMDQHRWKSGNTACDSPAYELTAHYNADGSTELAIDLSPDASPWFWQYSCTTSSCQPSGHGELELDFTIDRTFPFLDGQVIEFQHTWDADNLRHAAATRNEPLTVNVQPEMQIRLEPVCSGAPGASGRHPGARLQLLNSGGRTLDAAIAIVPIPRAADGSGTAVDTAYAGHFAPAGVTTDCSTDGGDSWATPCTPAATHVRFDAGSLSPYAPIDVEVYLDVPPGTAAGTPIFVTGGLDAATMLPIEAQTVTPAKVELCPGRIEVNLWFDTDRDGERDTNEPGFDWPVAVTQGPDATYPIPLTSQGLGAIAVPGGTAGSPERYGWSASFPTDGEAVWSLTRDVPEDLDVTTDGTANLDLPVACACDDGDACTTDSCDHFGQCLHQGGNTGPDPNETLCNGLDDDCDGAVDEEFPSATTSCGVGACVATGQWICNEGVATNTCVEGTAAAEVCNNADDDCDGLIDEDLTQAVACAEGACAVGTGTRTCVDGIERDTCDPVWSAIPDTECGTDSIVAYAIVFDSRGAPVGTVRCSLSVLGDATCDEAPGTPGVLRVYDDLWCPGAAP